MPTLTLGAGLAPAGRSYAGYGSPATPVSPSGAALQQASGNVTGSRAIGTIGASQGRYLFGSDGRVLGMPSAYQLVYLAVQTVLTSSAQPTLGQQYSALRKLGDGFVNHMQTLVADSLADLVSRQIIRIDSIRVRRIGNSRIETRVEFVDLLGNNPYAVTLQA